VRQPELWKPSKFLREPQSGRYVPNPAYVGRGSRFVCSLFIDEYVRLIRKHASGVLLDCGCGDVPYYDIYRDKVTDTVCIDWEETHHGSDHVDQYVDLNGPLPFSDGTFDTVLLMDVLEHIARPDALIAELARVLRPGGVLLAGTPFLYWLHEQPHDYYRYTEFALRRFCAENGFVVLELEPYGSYPDVVLDLLNKRCVPNESAARVFLAFCRLVTHRSPYRRLRAATRATFPLGYCLAAGKSRTASAAS
jgi:SAM-dependent methyltransferase